MSGRCKPRWFQATDAAVSSLKGPAAPTPRAAGLFAHCDPGVDAVGHRVSAGPELPWRSVVRRLLLASPRGYCAGVERAVETVERALELHGRPVYVRRQIVHNLHVVRDLERRGAVFVESEADAPGGATLVLSAHGVAPDVYASAADRQLLTIDATCPLVTKVHMEARRFAAEGYTVVLIGHAGHDEVVGTTGEAPEAIRLVGSVEEAERLEVRDPDRVAYVTQTTLSVDETAEIVDVLKSRFPRLHAPPREDIC